MAKKNLTDRIVEILATEIPGTSRASLRKTASQLATMLTTDIPGTQRVDQLAQRIAGLLATEIPGTERVGVTAFSKTGRVQYALAKRNVKDLSARAQQVVAALAKHNGVGTSADLQRWMRVNRNVIAGALHELRQSAAIRSKRISG